MADYYTDFILDPSVGQCITPISHRLYIQPGVNAQTGNTLSNIITIQVTQQDKAPSSFKLMGLLRFTVLKQSGPSWGPNVQKAKQAARIQ